MGKMTRKIKRANNNPRKKYWAKRIRKRLAKSK